MLLNLGNLKLLCLCSQIKEFGKQILQLAETCDMRFNLFFGNNPDVSHHCEVGRVCDGDFEKVVVNIKRENAVLRDKRVGKFGERFRIDLIFTFKRYLFQSVKLTDHIRNLVFGDMAEFNQCCQQVPAAFAAGDTGSADRCIFKDAVFNQQVCDAAGHNWLDDDHKYSFPGSGFTLDPITNSLNRTYIIRGEIKTSSSLRSISLLFFLNSHPSTGKSPRDGTLLSPSLLP